MAFNQELPWFVSSPPGEKIERSLLSSHYYVVSPCTAARFGACWCCQFRSCDQCFGPVRERQSGRCRGNLGTPVSGPKPAHSGDNGTCAIDGVLTIASVLFGADGLSQNFTLNISRQLEIKYGVTLDTYKGDGWMMDYKSPDCMAEKHQLIFQETDNSGKKHSCDPIARVTVDSLIQGWNA
jgi:hypothetical protein